MIQASFPGACGNTTCVVCQVPAATTCVKQGITPVPEADCSRACLALGFKSTGKKPTPATCSARVQPPSASCGSLQTFWRLGKEVSNEGGARLARTVARISSRLSIIFLSLFLFIAFATQAIALARTFQVRADQSPCAARCGVGPFAAAVLAWLLFPPLQ